MTGGEGKDRQSLELPGVQEKLLETVAATGKPVVLVLYGPGIFSVNWAVENIAGIVQAWMPGPFAGEAVTNVLDGSFNPGGKLNVKTVPDMHREAMLRVQLFSVVDIRMDWERHCIHLAMG